MAAGVTKRLWKMSDVVDVLEAWGEGKCMNALTAAAKRLSLALNATDRESGFQDFKSTNAKNARERENAPAMSAAAQALLNRRHNQTDPLPVNRWSLLAAGADHATATLDHLDNLVGCAPSMPACGDLAIGIGIETNGECGVAGTRLRKCGSAAALDGHIPIGRVADDAAAIGDRDAAAGRR
jgi:hypothetical protein